MKISKLTAVASILLPPVLLLVFGWLIYPWLLNVVMAGREVSLVYPSIDALIVGRLWTALSLALLGAVTGGCILFLKYKTTDQQVSGIVTGLLLTAVGSAAGRLFLIQHKTTFAIRSPIDINMVAVSVEDIPVYQVGLFANSIVVLMTVLFSVWVNQKRRLANGYKNTKGAHPMTRQTGMSLSRSAGKSGTTRQTVLSDGAGAPTGYPAWLRFNVVRCECPCHTLDRYGAVQPPCGLSI